MKLIYQSGGFKVYDVVIEGYECKATQTVRSGCVVSVPIGDTPADKGMFDSLVYYHKGQYHGRTLDEAIENVAKFIREYKNKK